MLKEFKLRESEIEETSSRLAKYKGPTIRVEIDDGGRRIKLTVPLGEIDRKSARIKITIPVNDLELARIRYKKRNLVVL